MGLKRNFPFSQLRWHVILFMKILPNFLYTDHRCFTKRGEGWQKLKTRGGLLNKVLHEEAPHRYPIPFIFHGTPFKYLLKETDSLWNKTDNIETNFKNSSKGGLIEIYLI